MDLFSDRQRNEPLYWATLELIRRHARSRDSALDLGCGPGRVSAELCRRHVSNVVGLDLCLNVLEEAQELLDGSHHQVLLNEVGGRTASTNFYWPSGVHTNWLCADASDLPFSSDVFDLVVCLNLVDGVQNPMAVVSEAVRVVRPGGLLLIGLPYDWQSDDVLAPEMIDIAGILGAMPDVHVEEEVDGIPYLIRFPNSRRLVVYSCHLVAARRAVETGHRLSLSVRGAGEGMLG